MYDWANSAYITAVAGVLFPVFFAGTVVPEGGISLLGHAVDGQTLWGAVVGGGSFLLFLAMPVLGAVADFSHAKARFLRVFAYGGALGTVLLLFLGPGRVAAALLLFLLTFVAFVAGNVVYNGFLPEITTDDTIDAVSARGFALGYAGGGLQLLLAVAIIGVGDRIGLDRPTAERLAIATAGLWWGGFAAFALSRLRDPGRSRDGTAVSLRLGELVRVGFGRTWATTRRLRHFPRLLLFVAAFLLYNDGVQTVIALTSVYASRTLHLSTETILLTFLVVQFVAFAGALAFGRLAAWVGAKGAVLLSIGGWVVVTVGGALLPERAPLPFLLLGGLVGIVLGGVQALSRSLYGSMIPVEASAEFFGFFSVFSKFSAIWGPLLFAVVSATIGPRVGIASLTVTLVLGGALLAFVDVDGARASRSRWRFDGTAASTGGEPPPP